ncbi:MAG: hypothetical protein JXA11_06020 [Phycisphaerae bacterium]|nr:hypothetical protein [Phycisphaerae bacterium]
MSLKEAVNRVVDKCTTGPQAQYILGGTLVAIIALSLTSTLWNTIRPRNPGIPGEMRGYCLQTKQEFEIDPEKMRENMGPEDVGMMDGIGLIYSPFTKERTAVHMTQCPNCKKFFVPEHMKDALERSRRGESPMMMHPPEMDNELVCPECGTNVIQWYRENRKKKR